MVRGNVKNSSRGNKGNKRKNGEGFRGDHRK